MRSLIVLALLARLGGVAGAAPDLTAPPPRRPPVAWSVGAGMALALVGLAAGGGILATAEPEAHAVKRSGIYTISGGLALAPIVSHLVAREWKRAAIFGIAPLALGALAVGMLETSPDLLDEGRQAPRLVFGTALALQLLAAGIGLVDSLMAGERARRTAPVSVMPSFGPSHIGLAIGGTL